MLHPAQTTPLPVPRRATRPMPVAPPEAWAGDALELAIAMAMLGIGLFLLLG